MSTHTAAWARAALPLCLLGALQQEESHGYALLRRLTGAGLDPVKPATLYPALNRLAEEGAVEVEWRAGDGGPGRKCYRITEAGRARLAAERAAWQRFDTAVTGLTTAPEDGAHTSSTHTSGTETDGARTTGAGRGSGTGTGR